jgi:hypothetical protein
MEDKLVQLGVESGSGSINSALPTYAPHLRAASVSIRYTHLSLFLLILILGSQISSPADPALLHWRLNKLASATSTGPNSLLPSPHPPHSLSTSPTAFTVQTNGAGGPPGTVPRQSHGHSFSLATPSSTAAAPSFNPFGPNAVLGSDTPEKRVESPILHAPHARAAVQIARLNISSANGGSRPNSRPDFVRGFGLDITEEGEEEEEVSNHFNIEIDRTTPAGNNNLDTPEEDVEDYGSADVSAAARAEAAAELGMADEDMDLDVDVDVDQAREDDTDIEPDQEYTTSTVGMGDTFGPGAFGSNTSFLNLGSVSSGSRFSGMTFDNASSNAYALGQSLAQIEEEGSMDGMSTVAHSRHVSRLSAALSLASVGGMAKGSPIEASLVKAHERAMRRRREEEGVEGGDEDEQDVEGEGSGGEDHDRAAVEEWTGSEVDEDISDDEVSGL